MTALAALGLLIAILVVSGIIVYLLQTGTKSLAEMTKVYYNNEEVQEIVELAKDLYEEAPKEEVKLSQDISQEAIEKAVEISKVTLKEDTAEI